jgi:hypothetical protein
MGNKALKQELYRFFLVKHYDEMNSQSTDSILASLSPTEKQINFDMRRIDRSEAHRRAYLAAFWTKKHKDTRVTKKGSGRSCGGIDSVSFDPRLRELNRIYVALPAHWRNLLQKHILEERSYNYLADYYKKEYRLTYDQIRDLFRRDIYPTFYNTLKMTMPDYAKKIKKDLQP